MNIYFYCDITEKKAYLTNHSRKTGLSQLKAENIMLLLMLYQISLMWMKCYNVGPKTLKLPAGKHRIKFQVIGISDQFVTRILIT